MPSLCSTKGQNDSELPPGTAKITRYSALWNWIAAVSSFLWGTFDATRDSTDIDFSEKQSTRAVLLSPDRVVRQDKRNAEWIEAWWMQVCCWVNIFLNLLPIHDFFSTFEGLTSKARQSCRKEYQLRDRLRSWAWQIVTFRMTALRQLWGLFWSTMCAVT